MGQSISALRAHSCCAAGVSPSIIIWPTDELDDLVAATPEPEYQPKKIAIHEVTEDGSELANLFTPILDRVGDLLESSDFKLSLEGSRGHVYNIHNVSDEAFAIVKGHSAPNCGSDELQAKYVVCSSSQTEVTSSNETIRWRHCINRRTLERCMLKISDRRDVTDEEERINLTLRTHNPTNHFLLPYIDIYHDNDCTYEVCEIPVGADREALPQSVPIKLEVPEKEVAKIIYHLLVAVKHLASLSILYRNIHIEDMCLLGSTYYVSNLSSCAEGEDVPPIGTPALWSKEVFERQLYTAKSAVYNIGLLAWLLIYGTHPFYRANMSFADIEQAASEKIWIRNTTPTLFMDREMRSFFLSCCLPEEEMDYACFDTLLDHEWLNVRNQ